MRGYVLIPEKRNKGVTWDRGRGKHTQGENQGVYDSYDHNIDERDRCDQACSTESEIIVRMTCGGVSCFGWGERRRGLKYLKRTTRRERVQPARGEGLS